MKRRNEKKKTQPAVKEGGREREREKREEESSQ
jgi:hypothetical protein